MVECCGDDFVYDSLQTPRIYTSIPATQAVRKRSKRPIVVKGQSCVKSDAANCVTFPGFKMPKPVPWTLTVEDICRRWSSRGRGLAYVDADIVQTFTEVYVDEILVEAICEKQMLANDKNIQIKLLNLEPTTSNGSVFLLKTAIANIIENAIKYSNENSSIEICLSDLRLTVKDFGIGIAAEEITKIFDRFYRVDKTRNHAFGSGLGLSIVKTICDLHNIKIDIESQQGVGTTMTLTFETQQEWSMV